VIWQNAIDKQRTTSVESLWKGATNHEGLRTSDLNNIKSQLHYYLATYYNSSYVVYSLLFSSWILCGNRFTLATLTISSKFETRKLHSNISQLHHITATEDFAATATF